MEMKILEIERSEYEKRLKNVPCGYMKSEFCEYNKKKIDGIKYLLFCEEDKERFVAVFGCKDRELLLPFSAPFSTIGGIKKETKIEHYKEALEALKSYTYEAGYKTVEMTFPPLFYDERDISYWLNACHLAGAKIKKIDLNYAIELEAVEKKGYSDLLSHNAKKNLRIAKEKGNSFSICQTEDEFYTAYDIIRQNREAKGYPLRMKYEQVRWTKDLLNGKFFIVRNGGKDLASAIVFEPVPKVAQVIYWGDVPYVSEYKSINYLAEQLVMFYLEQGFRFLDIGPSTEQGVPNYGLCDFKESIGCQVTAKITMRFEI